MASRSKKTVTPKTAAATRSREPKTANSPSNVWIYVALLVLTFAIYGQVWDHAFVNYDDPEYLTANPHIRDGFTSAGLLWAFTTGYAGNWFPLTWLSHMLDCQLFGLKAGPHHLTNLAIHLITTLLLFGFLNRTTKARWPSAFVAFVFALHPLHIESVAWAAERKDVLSALFWILTLWTYVKYTEKRTLLRYSLLVFIFCCGLMSKPMTVTLPIVLVLLDLWPLQRWVMFRRIPIVEKIPLFALSLASSVITYVVQQREGAVASVNEIPIVDRVWNAFSSYFVYIAKLCWPSNLAVFYPYPDSPQVFAGILSGVAILAITAFAIRWRRQRPYFAAGWLWYLITLLPVIGIVQVGLQSHADRYTYVPMIGISIVLAWGSGELFERMHWSKNALAAIALAVCAGWSVITWINLQYWRDSVALFEHTIEVTDRNYIAYNYLGNVMSELGRTAEAISNYERGVTIHPQAPDMQDNLGVALTASGRAEEALPHLERALQAQPDFVKGHLDLAVALVRTGKMEDAKSHYLSALRLQPDSPEAQYGLGGVLAQQGHMDEAMPHLQAGIPHLLDAIARKPDSVEDRYNLGVLYAMMGRTDDAIVQFSEAVKLRPDDAESQLNLGTALVAKDRVAEAIGHIAAAVQLRPADPKGHLKLAQALAATGHVQESLPEFREALRLAPDLAEARQGLEYFSRSVAK